MGTSQDTFLRFVDSLTWHLDDHQARGDELAARAHLSRFHFDRVIGAVAGESPGRFRRRVLLERGAYRLITSRMSVLDVAVEAGYSSNEAFTRAFKRAFGTAPSAWRATPRRFQLPRPNGVHFHPPGSLRLPARSKVTAMDLLTKMVEHHIWLTGEMIDLTPADYPPISSISRSNYRWTTTGRRSARCCPGWWARWTCGTAPSPTRPYDWSLEDQREHRRDARAAGEGRAGVPA